VARSLPGFNDGTASRRRIGVSKVVSTVGISHTLCSRVWFGAALRSWPARYEEDHEQYIEQADQIIASGAGLTDKQKMIAEYWALGPGSVTPPGRWFEFAQYISERDHHTLDDDVNPYSAQIGAEVVKQDMESVRAGLMYGLVRRRFKRF